MTNLSDLIATTLPSSVRVHGGTMPHITVESAHARAEVYFQGAHVTAWHPAISHDPVLWMSRSSLFEPGRPIRGGVPICFPWFGAHPADPSAPAHGFARLREWKLVDAQEEASGDVTLALELAGEGLSPHWAHRFRARHRITIGTVLRLELDVHNDDGDAFTFEEALHSYFAVRDIHDVAITGLESTEYIDKVGGLARGREGREPLHFRGETDRVYLGTRADCVIHDGTRRRISISKTGSEATVVWNPWIAKARATPDFGDDEWPGMVCVETGNVGAYARRLAPGESLRMMAIVGVQE